MFGVVIVIEIIFIIKTPVEIALHFVVAIIAKARMDEFKTFDTCPKFAAHFTKAVRVCVFPTIVIIWFVVGSETFFVNFIIWQIAFNDIFAMLPTTCMTAKMKLML